MEELIKRLRAAIEGEVREDPVAKRVYSVDASIFEVEPLCVVTPRSKEDVIACVKLANVYGVPVVPRGAATGITGGCLGSGIVIDLSKYLNHILEINSENGYVVCEPGVIQDQLNDVLRARGFRLGPDTSTGNRATLGGMLANNAAGSRSLKYGKMVDHVLEVELVLAEGEIAHFKEVNLDDLETLCAVGNRESEIYQTIKRMREEYQREIELHFPKLPRMVSGYNLNELTNSKTLNVSKIIAGSEGTLGIVIEITLRIVPIPKKTGLVVIHFNDMIDGMRAIDIMLGYNPIAIEMIDSHIIEMGKQSRSVHDKLEWLIGNPEAVFAIELEDFSENILLDRLNQLKSDFETQKIGYAHVILTSLESMSHVWLVRKAGLGLLMSKRSYSRAVAFIEDISVSPEKLADFMTEYRHYMQLIGKESGIYGHVGSGCMHIRPYMDVRKEEDFRLMHTIMKDITEMLMKYGGVLSGEHGDGLVRSWLNPTLFGEKIYQAFIELKKAFDPKNLMNPGKIVFPKSFENDRRMDPKTVIHEIETFQDFSREGGFALSADLCNGNGQCRKRDGTMCPSFQASNDEMHTTRARAQMLRGIITGRLPMKEFTGEGLHEVLDLCIGCKGCKKECPSQVDMAKMKAEFLYHYHKKHGRLLRDRLFAFVGEINRFTSPFASFVNVINSSEITKNLLSFLGITPNRSLPKLAQARFSQWVKKHTPNPSNKKVVLFNDTFTEFHVPDVGIAATHILESLGYSVIIPRWQCCGRTLISKGFLPQAKQYASSLISSLGIYAEQGIPIIGLEPSCILTIKDDFEGLLGYDHVLLKKIRTVCITFDEFIARLVTNGVLPLNFIENSQNIVLHGHCHQKALIGTSDTLKVLQSIPGAIVSEVPTGCCGMAGSFGYEKEHHDFSVKIAEQQLLPSLKNISDDAIVVANGFSCRSQIEHLTEHKPKHLAEVLFKEKDRVKS